MDDGEQLRLAIERIDALHDEDPASTAIDGRGPVASERLYAERMTSWLGRIEPDASPELQIAVRAQHLCRWRLERSDYPMDRAGYKRWRTELGALHAQLCADVLAQVGYEAEFIERVRTVIRKQGIKRDPEVQTLEDVACLVFLDHYIDDFSVKHDDEKMLRIIRKTWSKMSKRGQQRASTIELGGRSGELVEWALRD